MEEAELRRLRVEVGLELPDAPLVFPEGTANTEVKPGSIEALRSALVPLPPGKAPEVTYEEHPFAGTMKVPLHEAKGPVLPFATNTARAVSEARPAAAQAPKVKYEEHPFAGTMKVPLQEAKGPVLPFAPATAGAVSEARPAAAQAPKAKYEEHPFAGTMKVPPQEAKGPVLPFAPKTAGARDEEPPEPARITEQTAPLAPLLPDSAYRARQHKTPCKASIGHSRLKERGYFSNARNRCRD